MRRSIVNKAAIPPPPHNRITAATQFLRNKSREHRTGFPTPASPAGATYRRPASANRASAVSPLSGSLGGYGLVRKDDMLPRYPNYLPEMKARRAIIAKHPNSRGSSVNSGMMQEINYAMLRDLLNLREGRTQFPPLPHLSFNAVGHTLRVPPERVSRHYPDMVLSLYRAPAQKVLEWETGSPTIQLENMRRGGCVGPSPSQLPSPESSHSVLLSMRGRNRAQQDSITPLSSYRRK